MEARGLSTRGRPRARLRALLPILLVGSLSGLMGWAQASTSVSWVPSVPEAGDGLTVFLQGFAGVGAVSVELRDVDAATTVDQDHVAVAQGFATLQLPDRGGRFRIVVFAQSASAGAAPLYQGPTFIVDPPSYRLDVPPTVDLGTSFTVALGRTGGRGDVAVIVPESDPAASPLVVAPVDGVASAVLDAPSHSGSYLVEVLSGVDGSVLASASFTVGTGSGDFGSGCSAQRSEASLKSAFGDAVQSFLNQAQAIYGSRYRDVQYDYQIGTIDVTNDQGYVTASYSGSVTEIASGKVDTASGTIDAWFRWQGCSWVMNGFTY